MVNKMIRIASCGTSLTYQGDGWNPWQVQVARGLVAERVTRSAVFNFGESGVDSSGGLTFLGRALRVRAEICVLEYCMNDAYIVRGISVAAAKANHQSMISQLRAADSGVKICLLILNPPIAGGSIAVSERANYAAYAQGYRDLCVEDGNLTLIDCAPTWVGATVADCPDGVHPTKAAETARNVPIIIDRLRTLIT